MTSPEPAALAPSAFRRLLPTFKVVALVVVLGWFGAYLVQNWAEGRKALVSTDPRWPLLAASALVVLGAYAALIQVWRSILAGAGESLPFWSAARIWTVSNLGKYVPGKVWQMSAMAVMARARGISGVAAAGSSILSALVTLVTGLAVTVVTGAGLLPDRRAALLAAGVSLAALAVMPIGLPIAERMLQRMTGRGVTLPRLGLRAFVIAVVGSSVGWLLLGTGFHLLAQGLGVVEIRLPASIAVFVASYLVGFLALFAPGGVGPRESVMQALLESLGVARGEALVLVVASRLWLTVLEILPALLFLGAGALSRRPDVARDDKGRA